MPDIRVQDEQGNVHVFPDEATPEMIAGALNVKPPTPAAADTQTPPTPSLYQRLTQPDQTTANPVARFFSNVGGAVIGAPGAAASAIAHPIDTIKGMGNSVNSAIDAYSNPATRPTLRGAASVAPEALGMATGNVAAGEAGGAALPWMKNTVADSKIGEAVSDVTAPARNKVAGFLRSPATARQSQLGKPGTPKDILPPELQKYTVPPWLIPKGNVGTPTNPGPFMDIPARMPKAAAAPTAELGSAENPGWMSKIPNKMPKPASTPFAEAQSAEGVPGTLPKPSGRIIKLPQEFAAEDQLQGIAKTRASQRGMQFAAGMKPGEGSSIPRTATTTNTVEFPDRGNPTPFNPSAMKTETDSLGIRWAVSPEGYRVSVPKSVPDEGIAEYATPKLAEQAKIHALPWMRRSQQ